VSTPAPRIACARSTAPTGDSDRYVAWVGAFAQLDLGVSYSYRRPVAISSGSPWATPLSSRVPPSAGSLPSGRCGRAAARRRKGVGRLARHVDGRARSTRSRRTGSASCWVWIASVTLRWLPSRRCTRSTPPDPGPARILDSVRHLILPCLCAHPSHRRRNRPVPPEEMRSALALPCVRAARRPGRLRASNRLAPCAGKRARSVLTTLFGLGLPAAGWRERPSSKSSSRGRGWPAALPGRARPRSAADSRRTGVVSVMVVPGGGHPRGEIPAAA